MHMYVLVQFYSWFKFYFPLFLGMVLYDNEFKTKENKIWTKDKIEPQHTCTIMTSYVLGFNFIFGLKFFKPVWFLFPFGSGYDCEYQTMKYKNQTALKNFKPNIKLNHDICNPCKLMMKQLVREVCQLLIFDFLKKNNNKQTKKTWNKISHLIAREKDSLLIVDFKPLLTHVVNNLSQSNLFWDFGVNVSPKTLLTSYTIVNVNVAVQKSKKRSLWVYQLTATRSLRFKFVYNNCLYQ